MMLRPEQFLPGDLVETYDSKTNSYILDTVLGVRLMKREVRVTFLYTGECYWSRDPEYEMVHVVRSGPAL